MVSIAEKSIKAFLKPGEVAEMMSISKPTVYRLVAKRVIPFYKIGGSLRFRTDDVIAHLRDRGTGPFSIYERKKKEQ